MPSLLCLHNAAVRSTHDYDVLLACPRLIELQILWAPLVGASDYCHLEGAPSQRTKGEFDTETDLNTAPLVPLASVSKLDMEYAFPCKRVPDSIPPLQRFPNLHLLSITQLAHDEVPTRRVSASVLVGLTKLTDLTLNSAFDFWEAERLSALINLSRVKLAASTCRLTWLKSLPADSFDHESARRS